MISRVAVAGDPKQDPSQSYMKMWYPEVEPSVLYFMIPNKAMLVKYVLHAKHRKINDKVDKFE